MRNTKLSYKGKKVYVGIDVHKISYSVTVLSDQVVVKKDRMRADSVALVKYLKNHFKGAQIYSVYEAGFSGLSLHRKLSSFGIHNIVINPASIAVAANDKVKTDKRDSKKLAEQLSYGALKAIYIPSEKEESKRVLTRTRDQIVKQRSRVSNQIKSKLHYFGLLEMDDTKKISAKYLRTIESMDLSSELTCVLELLIEQWRVLTQQHVKLTKKIAEQATEDVFLESIYRSAPGVGAITARVLSNELGNLYERFNNEKSLFCFTGLTPSEHSSGEQTHKGKISRQGSSRIRKYLVESAWRAIVEDPALLEIYNRISKTRGKKRAIIAIARKLIGRIRSCIRQECPYQLGVYA